MHPFIVGVNVQRLYIDVTFQYFKRNLFESDVEHTNSV